MDTPDRPGDQPRERPRDRALLDDEPVVDVASGVQVDHPGDRGTDRRHRVGGPGAEAEPADLLIGADGEPEDVPVPAEGVPETV